MTIYMSVVIEFCKACAEGDIAKILQLLTLPTSKNMLEQAMNRIDSPLYLAATNNQSAVCEILLRTEVASFDEGGPIRRGIDMAHPITHKTALQTACELGYYDAVYLLYDAGASHLIGEQELSHHAFFLAAENRHMSICQLLLEGKRWDDDLRQSIDKDEVDFVLLLMGACHRQDYTMAELLLVHCDDPSEVITCCDSYNGFDKHSPYCPLRVACDLQDLKMIRLLLGKCAEPPPDALHIAITSELYDCIACVVNEGGGKAFVNEIQDILGDNYSPLQLCSKFGLLSVIELLVDNGATPMAEEEDISGTWVSEALHIACEYSHMRVIEYWLGEGATLDGDSFSISYANILIELGADLTSLLFTNTDLWPWFLKSTQFLNYRELGFDYPEKIVTRIIKHALNSSGGSCIELFRNVISNAGFVHEAHSFDFTSESLRKSKPLNLDVVVAVAEMFADYNSSFVKEMLLRAAYHKEIELAKELLARGALFDYSSELFSFVAFKAGSSIIAPIVASGVDVNKRFLFTYRQVPSHVSVTIVDFTFLMLACSEGWVEACTQLLEAGADPNAQDFTENSTPLHWLTKWIERQRSKSQPHLDESEKITRLLLQYGAQPNLKNCYGFVAQNRYYLSHELEELIAKGKNDFIGSAANEPENNAGLKRKREENTI